MAAAAGGCMLVRRSALEAAGGLAAIRGALIDDLALARAVKRAGGRVRLRRSEGAVTSVRAYEGVGDVWRMVRRSAFTQLRRSWLLLGATLGGPGAAVPGPRRLRRRGLAALAVGGAGGWAPSRRARSRWALAAVVALPAVRAFGLRPAWALTLPLGGALYGGMTLDSALRGPRGGGWR